jgi:protein O-GlcNAc transferase
MATAVKHHAQGQFADAETCYRQVLAQHAEHADAWNGLAVLEWQQGFLDQAFNAATAATVFAPKVPRYQLTLGLIASAMQRPADAARAFEHASLLAPESPEAWSGLAQAQQALGRLEEAVAAYRRAASLAPLDAAAANNFGVALESLGKLEEAASVYLQALTQNPELIALYVNLGNALHALQRYTDAQEVLRHGLQRDPASSELWFNYGNALAAQAEGPEAVAAYIECLKISPAHVKALLNLGNLERSRRDFPAAIECYRKTLAVEPGNYDGLNNLGSALWAAGEADEALAVLQRAIDIRPEVSVAYNNLGNVLKDTGRVDDAIAAYRSAVQRAPEDPVPHSNLVYSLAFHPDYDERRILGEAREWDRCHATPLARRAFAIPKRLAAGARKPLHVGYVSPDFREHCQSLFTLPLFAHHDRGAFKIHCYAQLPAPDATSHRLASFAHVWRPIHNARDAEVDAMIRADGIDILVDLTMHMSNGRPLVFARRPAPIQVAWLAYPGTTGQSAMDYRLTDPWLDPLDADEGRYAERSIRLPKSFWCYDPGADTPAVNSLPALTRGYVTFGCLNNFCKVSDISLRLWGRILAATPNSRLILLAAPGRHRSRVAQVLSEFGIAQERIEFVPYQARRAYLETYHRIDVCLDTLPYNGHTTSLDAYWMGVPVMTRVGATVVGRAGLSQLNNLSLPQLVTFDDAEFVHKCVAIAGDLPGLTLLREQLRGRMSTSALTDGAAFAGAMEEIYWRLWNAALART